MWCVPPPPHTPFLFPPLATCLLWCPFPAWGPPLSGVKERPGTGGQLETATISRVEVPAGPPVGWESTSPWWLWPSEGGGGRNEQGCCPRRGGGGADVTCRHGDMPAQTATCTPRDTQADSRTGAAGHTHMGTREKAGCGRTGELRGVGHTHGRPAGARTHAQGHTEMLSPTGGKEESPSTTFKKKKGSLSHACMNTGQLHAATRYKRPCHSRAHTCSREPSHTEHYRPPARWLSLRQSKPWLHINTCIHNVATSILLDYYYCGSPRLLPRKLNVFA